MRNSVTASIPRQYLKTELAFGMSLVFYVSSVVHRTHAFAMGTERCKAYEKLITALAFLALAQTARWLVTK